MTAASSAPVPEVSHGRGGAGNIHADETQYVDGSVVRSGAEGSHGDGAYSVGRGGELCCRRHVVYTNPTRTYPPSITSTACPTYRDPILGSVTAPSKHARPPYLCKALKSMTPGIRDKAPARQLHREAAVSAQGPWRLARRGTERGTPHYLPRGRDIPA
jgi:hypothetical protein